jgi:hypothetical protein
VPRQGEFDNLHVAAQMNVVPSALPAQVRASMGLDKISMAPFCVHDCLHTHFRWGDIGVDKPFLKGWSDSGQPYAATAAPLVPPNQTVRLTLQSPATFIYEASLGKPIPRSKWQVIFHHGSAYSAGVGSDLKMNAARAFVESNAISSVEHNFTPLTAANSFAIFYWRLRFGGGPNVPMERVLILAPEACRAL